MSLLSKDLATLNAGSGYKFSAAKVTSLGASEYTLVTLAVDASFSVDAFAPQLEANQCETLQNPPFDSTMKLFTTNDGIFFINGNSFHQIKRK